VRKSGYRSSPVVVPQVLLSTRCLSGQTPVRFVAQPGPDRVGAIGEAYSEVFDE
jgi:hypothetical protein